MVVVRTSILLTLLTLALAPVVAHDRISTKVTWEREIAPIVQARCVSCHRDGGRAPMSLATYEEARPWAKAIKEEVLTRRMPKWHVVRGYGDFANDPSLSSFEVALIASWADGGAPAFAKRKGTEGKALPAAAPVRRSRSHPSPLTREVTIPCRVTTVPAGQLLAVKPVAPAKASVRVTMAHADGSEEPLIWLKAFDPAFPETYWLRNPLAVSRGMKMLAASPSCSMVLTYGVDSRR